MTEVPMRDPKMWTEQPGDADFLIGKRRVAIDRVTGDPAFHDERKEDLVATAHRPKDFLIKR